MLKGSDLIGPLEYAKDPQVLFSHCLAHKNVIELIRRTGRSRKDNTDAHPCCSHAGFLPVAHSISLMLSMLGKNFSRQLSEILFSYFSQKTGFDISCRLSSGDNLHEMANPIFWKKGDKNIISLSSAACAQRVLKFKHQIASA